jgi:hypothetical protein
MLEGVVPMTRLSAIEELPGWLKVTDEPLAMEKSCQVRITLSVDWLMIVDVDVGDVIVAEPATTLPPVGRPPARATTEVRSAVKRQLVPRRTLCVRE